MKEQKLWMIIGMMVLGVSIEIAAIILAQLIDMSIFSGIFFIGGLGIVAYWAGRMFNYLHQKYQSKRGDLVGNIIIVVIAVLSATLIKFIM